ncbi:MAG: magnesium transporter [Chlamydiales bacterium]|nr:magnesium transporter [Chlamydiales bacterium]
MSCSVDHIKVARDYAAVVETVIPLTSRVEEALVALRQKNIQQKIIYFYVVDDRQKLKGVVSTRQLLLADPNHLIEEMMQDTVIKVRGSQTLQEVMQLFSFHSLLALPVVDEEERLLGMIDVQMMTDQSVDVGDLQSRSELFQMIGLTLEDEKKIPMLYLYRRRMPWILCNVFSGMVCAIISRHYELVLGKYLLLAFFIPLVLTLSESTSMQSMTQSLLFLRRPRLVWKVAFLRGLREWRLMIFIGLSLAALVGGLSLFWGEGLWPSFCIGVGIFTGISFSVLFGIGLPVILHKWKLDPKVASGPVVLMLADMITTAIYLGFASWLLLR